MRFFAAGKLRTVLAVWLLPGVVASLSLFSVVRAEPAAPSIRYFNIPPSDLASALDAFVKQTDLEIIYASSDVDGAVAKGVQGDYSAPVALRMLIGETGLAVSETDDGVFVVKRASLQDTAIRLEITEQADQSSVDNQRGDEMIVTGTNIRSVKNASFPLQVFDDETILATGAATPQDFIRTLPINLDYSVSTAGGLAGESAGLGGASAAVDLRGLGPSATLTLVNGRRLTAGFGFVDISMLPLIAVDRIDVMPDGGSAVYGSDAIAGAVNFSLRNSTNGPVSWLRFGGVTEGGYQELQASQMIGSQNESSEFFAVYEFLKTNALDANDREFAVDVADPTDLFPRKRQHSIAASVRKDVTSRLSLSAYGSFADRSTDRNLSSDVSGVGAEFTESNFLFSFLEGRYELSDDWLAEIAVGYSRDKGELDRIASDSPDFRIDFESELTTLDAKVEGPVAEIPGGSIRLALGGRLSSEEFYRSTTAFQTEIVDRDRKSVAVFGELFVPLVGLSNSRPGLRALDINAAGRFESFSDFGDSFNPKFGLRYAPTDFFDIRASYSSSYKAPGYFDLGRGQIIQPLPGAVFAPSENGPAPNVLVITGGNTDLTSETARTWTAGVDIAPQNPLGVAASLTYYSVRMEDRVSTPGVALQLAIARPETFGDAIIIDPELSTLEAFYTDPNFLNTFNIVAEDIGAIIDNRLRNVASTEVRGLDLNLDGSRGVLGGDMTLGLNAGLVFNYESQNGPGVETVSLLNSTFYPVDLRFRANAGWSNAKFSADVWLNYTSNYQSTETGTAVLVGAWTTVDAAFSYQSSKRNTKSLVGDILIQFGARNLFDEAPPFVALSVGPDVNYDGKNANPLGRFLYLSVEKAW
ncbi:MAG: TonB-dependent receptor [Pseudomonadota bacterium]